MRNWFALLSLVAACGVEEGAPRAWEHGTSRAKIEMIQVPRKPPFSSGIFPCSRCHLGGEPVADTAPAIPHAKHLARDLACIDCHDPDETGTPVSPKAEWCFECHDNLEEETAGVRAYLKSTRQDDGTYAFPHRWKTHDIIANHAGHNKANVTCVECHGEPTDAPFHKPKSVPLMERCVDCHQKRKAPTDCKACHTKIREPQHRDIVLKHAEKQRGCLDCHSPVNRDVLHLVNGTQVPFEESYVLCGQCHGPKLRDWKAGLHGKRTGHWDGRKEYLLCVHCHTNPHAPAFPHMVPDPPPMRPENIR